MKGALSFRAASSLSMAAAAMASMSPTGKSRPLTPSSMSSGTPPTRVAMAGTAGHGFERGEAEGLHLGGHEHEVGEREELVDVVLLAEEVDAVGDAEARARYSAAERSGPSPMSISARGHGAGDAGEDLDDVGERA
jgi:hypothetical protein